MVHTWRNCDSFIRGITRGSTGIFSEVGSGWGVRTRNSFALNTLLLKPKALTEDILMTRLAYALILDAGVGSGGGGFSSCRRCVRL